MSRLKETTDSSHHECVAAEKTRHTNMSGIRLVFIGSSINDTVDRVTPIQASEIDHGTLSSGSALIGFNVERLMSGSFSYFSDSAATFPCLQCRS